MLNVVIQVIRTLQKHFCRFTWFPFQSFHSSLHIPNLSKCRRRYHDQSISRFFIGFFFNLAPLCAIPSERVKEQLGENDTIWQIVGWLWLYTSIKPHCIVVSPKIGPKYTWKKCLLAHSIGNSWIRITCKLCGGLYPTDKDLYQVQ